MLDIKWVREHQEEVKESLRKRGVDLDLARLLAADEGRRKKIKEADGLRARRKKFSSEVFQLGGAKEGDAGEVIEASRDLKQKLSQVEFGLDELEKEFKTLMYQFPNISLPEVPMGKDERDNVILREVGEKPQFDFPPRDYMEIAAGLDLIDTERAAKVSGSRFGYIKGDLARMEFALAQFAFERLIAKGFIPIVPPVMVREEMMRGMGYIDTAEDRAERYEFEKDNLFLVGTAEQSVVPMHADEVFAEKDLPRRYIAFSSCFRREAGSYGKDTRGILRVHQFDKVEMVSFTKPEDSKKEHEFFLRMEEELMRTLNLPYRVVALCAGDLSRPSAATFDVEAWLPGQKSREEKYRDPIPDTGIGSLYGGYRETHSCSNTTDFQARRLNIRYRPSSQFPVPSSRFVHILNGTAFAIGRTLIAIVENYQEADGSVVIPEALQPYMGGMRFIKR